jgi:hypothetical protein
MHRGNLGQSLSVLAVVAGLALVSACEAKKSSNPLSPNVAGPIAGVEIGAPKLLEPASQVNIAELSQPIKLLIENSWTTGDRPLSYLFEVASDPEFKSKVFARDGVAPGGNGRTQLTLSDKLTANRTYFWRARASDGANASAYAATASFNVQPPAVIRTPVPTDPINDERTSSRRPWLTVRNADKSGPVGHVTYHFEVARDAGFGNVVTRLSTGEGGGSSRTLVNVDLAPQQRYFWRARGSGGGATGPWSATASFTTPAVSAPAPSPSPNPGPNPGAACAPPYPNNGPALVECVERKYPQYLVAGVSVERRKANMAFLRDKIIEFGTCGGMRMAWNMKRGGPEKSIDYLAYHNGSAWIGVDVGSAYDATHRVLNLVWNIDKPTPHAAPYTGNPGCQ